MGFSSYDQLIQAITASGQSDHYDFFKAGTAPTATAVWHTCWADPGAPAAGATPATTPGTSYSTTAGGIGFPNVSTKTRHMLTFGASAVQNCALMVYDRLVAVSGIGTTTTGSKTISSTALPRYTSGTTVQAWLEFTTASATGSTLVAHLLSYTGDVNGAGQVGGSITAPAAIMKIGDMVGPMPLAAGDAGITAISTLNVDTANTTTGIVNVVLLRPLAYLPIIGSQWNERDMVLQLAALERLYDGHTLGFQFLAGAASAQTIWGSLRSGYN